ncbi:MAG: 4-hydroxy-tetrahydrodipicolinate synthase [Bacteroidales bacterium]
MSKIFSGTGVALVTPFTDNKNIDFASLDKILDFQISNGISYLVVLGTTGESVTLSGEEKKELISHIVRYTGGSIPLVLGIGGNNTSEVLHQIEKTDLRGIEAILSVSPYYNKPTQEGVYQHYAAIAKKSPLPVIMYNVPGRTGSNMAASTTLRLAGEFPNLIAVKEASGNMVQIMDILHKKPDHFSVISGDDILTLPMIAMGAIGVISVAAQAVPSVFSKMVNMALQGKIEEARQLHYQIQDLMNALFADGSPGGIKAALCILGYCRNELRLPLVPVNSQVYQQIEKILAG